MQVHARVQSSMKEPSANIPGRQQNPGGIQAGSLGFLILNRWHKVALLHIGAGDEGEQMKHEEHECVQRFPLCDSETNWLQIM